eukprot:SAG22_NODE_3007_length_2032_cov_5.127781_2_plen_309_part_00
MSGDGALSAALVCRPGATEWTTLPARPLATTSAAAVELSPGKVLVVGGCEDRWYGDTGIAVALSAFQRDESHRGLGIPWVLDVDEASAPPRAEPRGEGAAQASASASASAPIAERLLAANTPHHCPDDNTSSSFRVAAEYDEAARSRAARPPGAGRPVTRECHPVAAPPQSSHESAAHYAQRVARMQAMRARLESKRNCWDADKTASRPIDVLSHLHEGALFANLPGMPGRLLVVGGRHREANTIPSAIPAAGNAGTAGTAGELAAAGTAGGADDPPKLVRTNVRMWEPVRSPPPTPALAATQPLHDD